MGLIRKFKGFIAGACMGFLLAACASEFPYKYYGLDLKAQKLRGPTAVFDIDLSVCNATANDDAPCTAMMTDAFLQMKKAYKDMQAQLIACEQGRQ